MSGFFPVMMFGLPGACLAMYHTARPERRAAVAGLLLSLALTSFLTGVTEPVEFTFMFLAPVLYALHAIATGLAMVVMNFFGVRLGFSFSAGLFDYVLNFSHAQRPLLLLPIGAAYFGLYYGVFRVCIVRLNLATPGRESTTDGAASRCQAPTARARPSLRDRPRRRPKSHRGGRHAPPACGWFWSTTRRSTRRRSGAWGRAAFCARRGSRIAGGAWAPSPIKSRARSVRRCDRTRVRPLQCPLPPRRRRWRRRRRCRGSSGGSGGAAAGRRCARLAGGPRRPRQCRRFGDVLRTIADPHGTPERIDESALPSLGLRGIARSAADRIQVLVAGPVEDWSEPLRRLL